VRARGAAPGAALAALTALAAVARFATLDAQGFWLDEAATVELLRLDLGGMLHRIPEAESTPPLYYLLAWLWSKVFGLGEVGLRSLSALLGSALVPAVYAAGRRLCSERVGLAAAALAAVNPLLVWYSQEARSYALLALLAAVSLWAFARLIDGEGGLAPLVWWTLASALALATHYFAAFLVLPEAAWLVSRPELRRRVAVAVAAVAATAAALVPLALTQRSLGLASFIAEEPLLERVARAAKNMLVGFDSPLETALALGSLLIAASATVAAFALARDRERSGALTALALGAVAVAIPVLLAALGLDYVDTRNLIGAWPALAVAIAAGLVAAGRAGLVALALLCAIGIAAVVGVASTPAWQRDDWRGMAEALGEPRGPRAIVVQPASGRRPLALYMPGLRALPAAGAPVSEILVLHPAQRNVPGEHPLPPPPTLPPPVPGFEVSDQRLTDTYAVVVLRASAGAPQLNPKQATTLVLSPGEPVAVLEQAP
jgi:mannosyltransferase